MALLEDLNPYGDITSLCLIDPAQKAKGEIIAKENGILACSHLGQEILEQCHLILQEQLLYPDSLLCRNDMSSKNTSIQFHLGDGESFTKGQKIASLQGSAHVILAAERTLLNFLQRLSGIATKTHKLVSLIKGYKTKLLDTRKTMPGMRLLEKEAFRCGGGTNHRFNLSDMILIKENHLSFYFSQPNQTKQVLSNKSSTKQGEDYSKKDIAQALQHVKSQIYHLILLTNPRIENVEIECEVNPQLLESQNGKAQLEEIISATPDIIMLDNCSPEQVRQFIKLIQEIKSKLNISKEIKLEASGGINENNITKYAESSVDFISTGSIFTQVNNIDLSMFAYPT